MNAASEEKKNSTCMAQVLLLQWNSWDCIATYFGVHYLGAVAVMATPTHVERKYLIKYAACKAVVVP